MALAAASGANSGFFAATASGVLAISIAQQSECTAATNGASGFGSEWVHGFCDAESSAGAAGGSSAQSSVTHGARTPVAASQTESESAANKNRRNIVSSIAH